MCKRSHPRGSLASYHVHQSQECNTRRLMCWPRTTSRRRTSRSWLPIGRHGCCSWRWWWWWWWGWWWWWRRGWWWWDLERKWTHAHARVSTTHIANDVWDEVENVANMWLWLGVWLGWGSWLGRWCWLLGMVTAILWWLWLLLRLPCCCCCCCCCLFWHLNLNNRFWTCSASWLLLRLLSKSLPTPECPYMVRVAR